MTTLLNLDTNLVYADDTMYMTNQSSPSSTTSDVSSYLTDSSYHTRYTMSAASSNPNNMSPMSAHSNDSSSSYNLQNLTLQQNPIGDSTYSYTVQPIESINDTINMQIDPHSSARPYLSIVEQPIDKFRFRYKSEMHGTHGSLTGVGTDKTKRTFPTVELHNYTGDAIIRCSLFQTNPLKKQYHSHSLVVRKDNDDHKDPHDVKVSQTDGYTAIFQGMGIIHTAKKYIETELYDKLVNRLEFEKGRPITALEEEKLNNQAKQETKHMNLNQVSLCFEAFRSVNGKWIPICESVLSQTINNMKSALTGELKISRLSSAVSNAGGNDDLFLFVEKVGKKNIKVRFYESNEHDEIVWEDFGRFCEADVHHQYAIALRTPPYSNKDIDERVSVFIQLVRPSDNCQSEPVKFFYKPRSSVTSRKRARISSSYSSSELPSVLNDTICNSFTTNGNNTTISREFNKSGLIDDFVKSTTNSQNLQSEDLNQFMAHIRSDSGDLLTFIDPKLISDELTKLETDSPMGNKLEPSKRVNKAEPILNIIDKMIVEQPKNARFLVNRFLTSAHSKGRNLLHMVLVFGDTEMFTSILAKLNALKLNILLEMENERKETCLHIACIHNKHEIISKLLQHGVDPNRTDIRGETALHISVRENFYECVEQLLIPVEIHDYTEINSKPINVNMSNDDGMTAIHIAARNDNLKIVNKLLNSGASGKIANVKNGNNILHIAVEQGSANMVKDILQHGTIDVNALNSSNRSALDLALLTDPPVPEIINCLLDCQGDVKDILNETMHYNFKRNSNDELGDGNYSGDGSAQQNTPLIPIASRESRKIKLIERQNVDDVMSIKEEIVDFDQNDPNADEQIPLDYRQGKTVLDEICLNELCEIFNESDLWKELAAKMDYNAYISVWAVSKNPSKMLFKFSEVQGTNLHYFIKCFTEMDSREALNCIDNMTARNLENDI